MRAAIYLKQHLFETNSHYEERVNHEIVTIGEKYKLVNIEIHFKQVIIFFEIDEKLMENPKRKIGFPITNNKH